MLSARPWLGLGFRVIKVRESSILQQHVECLTSGSACLITASIAGLASAFSISRDGEDVPKDWAKLLAGS